MIRRLFSVLLLAGCSIVHLHAQQPVASPDSLSADSIVYTGSTGQVYQLSETAYKKIHAKLEEEVTKRKARLAEKEAERAAKEAARIAKGLTPSGRPQRIDRGIMQTVFIPKGQWMAGGTVSYSEHEEDNLNFLVIKDVEGLGYTFNISPYVGYFFRDNVAAGIRAGYNRTYLDLGNFNLNLGEDFNINLKDLSAAGITVNVDGLQKGSTDVQFATGALTGDNDSMTFGLNNVGAAASATRWTSDDTSRNEFQIGTFSHYFNHPYADYEPLPDWAKEEDLPPESVRQSAHAFAIQSDSEDEVDVNDWFARANKKEPENDYYSKSYSYSYSEDEPEGQPGFD